MNRFVAVGGPDESRKRKEPDVILAILDIVSFLTVGLLTIPGWIEFFISTLRDLLPGQT